MRNDILRYHLEKENGQIALFLGQLWSIVSFTLCRENAGNLNLAKFWENGNLIFSRNITILIFMFEAQKVWEKHVISQKSGNPNRIKCH